MSLGSRGCGILVQFRSIQHDKFHSQIGSRENHADPPVVWSHSKASSNKFLDFGKADKINELR
jgi:hypothetical protein